MVYRQRRLFSILISGLLANISYGQEVKVLGLFGDRAFIKVDEKSAVIRIGQSHQNVQLKSISNQKAILLVDNKDIALGLGDSYQSAPPVVEEKKPEVVKPKASVTIYSNLGHQFITSGVINGRIVSFVVDTGATSISMSRKHAQRLGIDFRAKGKEGLSSTANGDVKHWQMMLNSVKVGAITLSFVEANIRDTEDDLPILLGMSFLSRVKLEQSGQKMVITEK
ncbi:MAG TPA: retropepsin-like aspartic protease [Agitococcus sp.]|nr:retropepsin-like aspartic protease [Agitococcus sp.]